jgi:hypothetical protein
MHAGRERNVVRWEVHHERLSRQLAETIAALAALEPTGEPQGQRDRERLEQLQHKRDDLQRRLQALGPSPSAKMG